MDPITLEFIGCDRCGRPVYEHDGRLYVDTDPRQHVAPKLCTKYRNTFDGEPDTPIDPQVQVSFIPHRDYLGHQMSITKLCDYCVKPAVYTDSSSRPGRRLMNETD